MMCSFFPKGLEQEWNFPNFWGTFENHPDNRHDVIKQVEKKMCFEEGEGREEEVILIQFSSLLLVP